MQDRTIYLTQVHHVNDLIVQTKTEFFKSKIVSASSKDLFRTVKGLLNRSGNSLPVHDSDSGLATTFARFFKSKVDKISAEFDTNDVVENTSQDTCNESETVLTLIMLLTIFLKTAKGLRAH